jgi:hypothetical protein
MAIEVLLYAELSGLRRGLNDPAGTNYSDADLRGYITDAIGYLRTKYVAQYFEVSGNRIYPEPDFTEQIILDLQSKILILQKQQFDIASNGGIYYRDPVKEIDTRNSSSNLNDYISNEEKRLNLMIVELNNQSVSPIGKPTWQDADATDDDSLNLNVIDSD